MINRLTVITYNKTNLKLYLKLYKKKSANEKKDKYITLKLEDILKPKCPTACLL